MWCINYLARDSDALLQILTLRNQQLLNARGETIAKKEF